MTIKHYIYVVTSVAIALGSTGVSAGQETPPYYDEETDTVVYPFVGRPITHTHEESQTTSQMRVDIPPYYDEESDTVVYPFVGRPVTQAHEEPQDSKHASVRIPPYYDEESDTVVYPFVGRQSIQINAMADMPE